MKLRNRSRFWPRHPRLRKVLLWTAGGLAALLVLLAVSVWFLAGTQSGTEFLFTRLGAVMPGSLEVAELRGPLRGPLEIRGLRYEREGMELYVERIAFEWRVRRLLERLVDVERLHAEGVRIVTTPSEEETEQKPLPDVNLRFNIIVRDAQVRGLTVSSSKPEPGDKPFVIDRIDLATTALGGEAVRVDRLTVRAPLLDADVHGTVLPRGDYPVDLDLRWALRLPDMAPFAGRGTLGGSLEDLRVVQRLTAPFDVWADLRLDRPLSDLRFAGTVRAPRLNPRLIRADLPDLPAQLQVTAEGTLEEFTGRGQARGSLPQTGPLAVDFEASRDGERWLVQRADVALPGTPTRLTLTGRVDLAGEAPAFAGEASWQRLAWPLRGSAPIVVSRQGTAKVEGTVEDFAANLQAHLAAPTEGGQIPPGTWTIAGRGDKDSFRFASLRGDILGGRLTGRGEVAWQPQVRWDLALQGAGISPQPLVAALPGRFSFVAASRGTLGDNGPVGTVRVSSLTGALRGQPLRAAAALELAGPRYRLTRLDATLGPARLSAAGWLGDRWDLGFTAAVPNLAPLVPQGAGSVAAEGRITGTAEALRLAATARGENLLLGTRAADGIEARVEAGLAPTSPLALDVTARGIRDGERRIDTLTLQGRGTRADHTVAAAARNADGSLELALAGGLRAGNAWQGAIRQLDLRSRPLGDWSLTGPAALAASAEAVRLADFCWQRAQGGRLCADGGWSQAGPWNVNATVASVPLNVLEPVLPPDLVITGALEGSVAARGSGAALAAAQVDLRPGPGEIRFPGQEGRTVSFRYEQGSLRAQAGAGGAGTASARLVLVDAGTLTAEARLPRFAAGADLSAQPLDGRVEVRMTDLGFLAGFVPAVRNPQGRLTAAYTLSGTVARPSLAGEAQLAGGRADLPEYGLELRELRLAAIGDGSGSLALDGSVRSGPGTLTLKGRAGLVPSAETPVRLAIAGRRVEAMDTEEIELLVSPDLEVAYVGDLVRVTGEVTIPEADVVIEDRRERGPVQASKDVVFVGQEPAPARDLAVAARVRLVLGKDIEVNVLGLKAEPTGSLLVSDEPRRGTRATGELEISGGTFKAYGQDLAIERGRLAFAGPIDNPAIDLRASRTADDGTVAGINAKGTLREPEVTLWSEPALPQAEALSYLLLGRPLRQAQPEEGDRLANAATALGLKGGNMLAKRLAARWGLEEARFESEDGSLDQASLVLGKYLSPRLYVGYGIGLFEAVNTFRIRYLIDDSWTLQAESGEGTSADVLYTVER